MAYPFAWFLLGVTVQVGMMPPDRFPRRAGEV